MARRRTTAPETQGSLFEEGFLIRTLGDLVRVPDVALSELVANAWDAGANRVDVSIPSKSGGVLSVADDGCGMTKEQFHQRWMTLAYNRQQHQGPWVEPPPGYRGGRRRAYGRNGQGRHGLLCFADSYDVETWRDGEVNRFEVRASAGDNPFVATRLTEKKKSGHGTRVSVTVARRLPDPDRIRDVLSSRFLHDPNFTIAVNGSALALTDLPGLAGQRDIRVQDAETGREIDLELFAIEGEAGRTKHQSGVAFWVGGRLVGEPTWTVGKTALLDGRTRLGRRFTFVVKTDDLFDEVAPDWTGFKSLPLVAQVFDQVGTAVQDFIRTFMTSRIQETTEEVLTGRRDRLRDLGPGERLEVAEMAHSIAETNPLLPQETISVAIDGLIQAKTRNSLQRLFERIATLSEADIDGMHRLLDEWSVKDAMTVLDEIGRRIKTVELIEKLSADSKVDELHALHPLVTGARWLFGPQFDSPLFSSNLSLRNAVRKVFGARLGANAFENPKKRPDLLIFADRTIGAVGADEIDVASGLSRLQSVLLIELKRGGSVIGRDEISQAESYVEDLLHCGLIDGPPYVDAFVVGPEVAAQTTTVKRIGDKPELGRVEAVTFGQLVRTANARLYRLREQVKERYPDQGSETLAKLIREPDQLGLLKV